MEENIKRTFFNVGTFENGLRTGETGRERFRDSILNFSDTEWLYLGQAFSSFGGCLVMS